MNPPRAPVIWLAYVSYPVTTAVYFERALRTMSRVVTCGPKIGPEIIEQWNLKNMKLPVLDQDMPLTFTPDMREVRDAARDRYPDPDLYLWIESVPGYFPSHVDALTCPKACYLIDTHLNLEWHVQWARRFDFIFIAQREYIGEFQRHGCRNVYWLPLACDPEIHAQKTQRKSFDIGFVGSLFMGSRRADLLKKLADKRFFLQVERCFWDDMALHFSKSRIVFNNAVRNDLNMRVFETMSTGTFLLTDLPSNSGQDELFVDAEDLGIYSDDNLVEKARHWLIHEEHRQHIARRAQTMAHQGHTYAHRCGELLRVCLNAQAATPSAGEWRERSLAGLDKSGKWKPNKPSIPQGRSFIIPVIDASPEGRGEFEALLTDLEKIEGQLIVIFNSKESADAFKNHPRIDVAASLSVNVGVARAWNLGTHLATQPTLFFFNADIRIERLAVERLEEALWTLPAAAVVGPQGSFVGFYTYEDIMYFDKGQTTAPLSVDAISGFLFSAKRELFAKKILQFENDYTPCFAEEWDLGLQVRQAGYRCYVVPVTGYSHEWGISGKPDKVVHYFKNESASVKEILSRNRIRFWRKWLTAAGELTVPAWEPNGPENPTSKSALLQSSVMSSPLVNRASPGTRQQ
jgi:hypothetical protein